MAQPIKIISLTSPAFQGLNTQDSPIEDNPQTASVADNLVVDSFGRLGARKGLDLLTTDNTLLGTDRPHVIHEYEDALGATAVFSVANAKILKGTTTLTDVTPVSYTITDPHFAIVNFNDSAYFFNQNHEPLVYDTTNGLRTMTSISGASVSPPEGKIALSAFSRLWVSGIAGEPNMIYWSDLLIGHVWDSGTAGFYNMDKAWPDGSDVVTGLASWNGRLIVFGRNSIVIFKDAFSASTIAIEDTITGIGCIATNTIQYAGTDLLFLSARGVMSLGRTIQEKSAPLNDVSKNVRDELQRYVASETEEIYAAYSAVNSFYLLSLPDNNLVYCFDTRGLLQNGAYRTTRWTTTRHYCFTSLQDDTLLVGNENGISKYDGYLDNDATYTVRYESNFLSFGSNTTIKFLKKVVPTLIGGAGLTATIKWGYGFSDSFRSQTLTLNDGSIAYFNEDEFEAAEFNSGSIAQTVRLNATGSGNLIKIGLEAVIDDAPLSLQEFNLHATVGRTY